MMTKVNRYDDVDVGVGTNCLLCLRCEMCLCLSLEDVIWTMTRTKTLFLVMC